MSLAVVPSCGSTALLDLVTGAGLVEADETVSDRSWRTATFFVGFLVVIVLNLESPG